MSSSSSSSSETLNSGCSAKGFNNNVRLYFSSRFISLFLLRTCITSDLHSIKIHLYHNFCRLNTYFVSSVDTAVVWIIGFIIFRSWFLKGIAGELVEHRGFGAPVEYRCILLVSKLLRWESVITPPLEDSSPEPIVKNFFISGGKWLLPDDFEEPEFLGPLPKVNSLFSSVYSLAIMTFCSIEGSSLFTLFWVSSFDTWLCLLWNDSLLVLAPELFKNGCMVTFVNSTLSSNRISMKLHNFLDVVSLL